MHPESGCTKFTLIISRLLKENKRIHVLNYISGYRTKSKCVTKGFTLKMKTKGAFLAQISPLN